LDWDMIWKRMDTRSPIKETTTSTSSQWDRRIRRSFRISTKGGGDKAYVRFRCLIHTRLRKQIRNYEQVE
jgi:hypothetical protein